MLAFVNILNVTFLKCGSDEPLFSRVICGSYGVLNGELLSEMDFMNCFGCLTAKAGRFYEAIA